MGRKPKVEQLRDTEDTFLDSIVERFGEAVLSNVRGDKVEAMSTGSLSLDASIGIGGFPRGRFTEIYGPEGSGKTTIALSSALREIDNGGKVLYLDAENMLSYHSISQMLSREIDQDKLMLLQPETAEQSFMIIEKAIASGEFTYIIVDSVAALEPQDEKDKEFDEFTMASLSRLLAKFFRRNAAPVKRSNVAVVLLNQVRDKIGSYTGGYTSTGGHALKHFTSVIVALTKGVDIKQGDEKIGINTKFVLKKNKLGAPFRSYEIPIIFGRGIDFYADTVSFCETLGIIQKNGAHYKFQGQPLGQGRNATAQFLRDNPETLDKITEMLYNILNKDKALSVELDDEEQEINE